MAAIEQIDFRVEVPEGWEVINHSSDEGLWVYAAKSGEHRLTVSILYYSREPTHDQQLEFLKDYIATRKNESLAIEPSIVFEAEELKEYSTAWILQYDERSKNARVARTKAISTRVGIANFYLESFSGPESHKKLSQEILSTTGFAS